MNINEGKRYIPTDSIVFANKNLDMKVYSSLQEKSNWSTGENHRYIDISKIKMKPWADELSCGSDKITRQTLKKRLDYLIKAKVVKRKKINDVEYYILPQDFKFCIYIDNKLLRFMTNTLNSNTIKVYLIYRSYTNTYGCCKLTQEKILEKIGLCSKSNRNKVMISDINTLLRKLDLIYVYKDYKNTSSAVKTPLTIVTLDERESLIKNKLIK